MIAPNLRFDDPNFFMSETPCQRDHYHLSYIGGGDEPMPVYTKCKDHEECRDNSIVVC